MSFTQVTGNERIKKILRRALQKNRIPHALLFTGQEGVGKAEMADVTAMALNCLNKKDDACGECRNCRAYQKGNFPDAMQIEAEKNILKINQMRALKEAAFLKPMVGRKRVFIIRDGERLNEEAANSLLKILEEPPEFTHIIMTARNASLLKPTILSRCQILSFSAISRETIEKELLKLGWDEETARLASVYVQGNLKKAEALAWEELMFRRQRMWDLLSGLARRKEMDKIWAEFMSGSAQSRSELGETLEILSTFCRDILLFHEEGSPELLLNPDFEKEIREIMTSLSRERSLDHLALLESSLSALDRNVNVQLLKNTIFAHLMDRKYV